MNKELIIRQFNLKPFGSRGFLQSENLPCPHCGNWDKFGIKLDGRTGYNCFHGKCQQTGTLRKLFKLIGRLDLIAGEYISSRKKSLIELDDENVSETDSLIEKQLPILSKRINQDDYLDSRGWLEGHYDLFQPCESRMSKFKDYVIFQIFQHEVRVAYLARSKRSKEWHKQNLKNHKDSGEILRLRYVNSPETDFAKILGGVDEITDRTDTVIVVEGIFDKIGVDNKLNLLSQEEVKCVFTFGNKISEDQINLLREKKSVKTIIMLYDPETQRQVQKYSTILSKHFKVLVGEIKGEKDPNEMSLDELLEVLDNLVPFMRYVKGRINFIFEK